MTEPFDAIAYINEPRWQASRLGLDRIRDLMERLGRPQDRLRFVHVAGTNGKGSTCAYLVSILRAAGYRTGLFTSPYIERFEERIQVGGANISPEALREVTLQVREAAEAQAAETGEHATEFELMTAVALVHFARADCDIVVLEVGLGGRLDSTNVIDAPEVAVVTRIGLDHTGLLGDAPAAIAGEKAGIIKPGSAVVAYPQDDEGAARAIAQAAVDAGDSLTVADFSQLEVGEVQWPSREEGGEGPMRPFSYKGLSCATALLAAYQPCNAAVAMEAAWKLRERGWAVSDEAMAAGIAAARWPGRFEVVMAPSDGCDCQSRASVAKDASAPSFPAVPVVVDGGHNPQGAEALATSLQDVFPGQRFVFVMGVLADKDYEAMVAAVAPLASAFVTATPPNPRALPAADLAECVRTLVSQVPVHAAPSYDEALQQAFCLAADLQPPAPVVAFGSLYAVATIKAALGSIAFSAA